MSSQKISTGRHGHGHGSGRGGSVFDMVKPFPPTPNPDSLMADIDAAIAASEHAHATALLRLSSNPQQQEQNDLTDAAAVSNNYSNRNIYDACLADEAYKSACAALASGRHDAAVRSLRIAIASCPPDKTSALSKLRSLMAIAESQQHKQKQRP